MSRPNTDVERLLEAWDALSDDERVEAFHHLPRSRADNFFFALAPRDQSRLILSLPPGERRIWMRLLAPDDATDVIQETPEHDLPGLLSLLDETAIREVLA